MKLGSSKAWAKTLGAGLANVQDGLDSLAEFAFTKLKNVGSSAQKSRSKNPYLKKTAKALGLGVSFLGQLGDSYYNEYEELKRKR